MPRLLAAVLLSAGMFFCAPALADNGCQTGSSDPAVSFPDGSYDYIFVVKYISGGGYSTCFYSPTTLDMSAFTSASVADLNQDGWADLAFGFQGSSGGAVQLFLNDKSGSGIVVLSATLATGAPHAPVLVGTLDLNGDGRPDILTDNGADGTASVMLNDGTGAFPAVTQYAAGSDITSIAAVDMDGDGKPDIVTTDNVNNAVDVLMNDGTGHFKVAVATPVGSGPYSMGIEDLNHDGHPDLVTENVHDGTVSVLLNNGDGTFAAQVAYAVPHLSFVSVIDVNNDGRPDIVTDFTYGAWYALVNNGDGTFAAPSWITMPSGSSSGGVDLSSGGLSSVIGSSASITNSSYSSGTGMIITPTGQIKKTSSGSSTTSSSSSSSSSGGGGTLGFPILGLLLAVAAARIRSRRPKP